MVDDEEAIREVARRNSGKAPRVSCADGRQRRRGDLAVCHHHDAVRLVLIDVMMPGMGGVELIQALRVLQSEARIVATSGLDQDDRRTRMVVGSCTEILRKPFAPAVLLKTVERALGSIPVHHTDI